MKSHPLIHHLLTSLPGDIRQRRDILASAVESLRTEEIPSCLRDSLAELDRHLAIERELQYRLPAILTEDATPDGWSGLGSGLDPLAPGYYLRTWNGYTVRVELRRIGSRLVEIAPSGAMTDPRTMPDATYVPVDGASEAKPAPPTRGSGRLGDKGSKGKTLTRGSARLGDKGGVTT